MSQLASRIRAYFDEGLKGDSSWWTWLSGFWFAVMFWFFASAIISIPMVIFMATSDPDGLQDFVGSMSTESLETGPLATLLGLLTFTLPILAVILFMVRKGMQPGARRIAMGVATACALISTVGLIHQMVSTPAEANEMLAAFIPKSPGVYATMLLTFPPLVFGLWLVLKFIHGRGLKTLMTAHHKFRWGRVAFSMLVFWAVVGSITFIAHTTGMSRVEGVFDPSRFYTYAAISLLLIPLQSASEEIVLRGYLNQGLGKYIKNPWVVFFITSAMFASLHLGNPEAVEGAANGKLLLTMSGYFMFGMFACVLTYIDGGLESAIGVHAANNLFASVMLGYDNSALPTPTVFKAPLNPDTDLIVTIGALGVVCLILWIFRKPLVTETSTPDTFA